VLASASNEQVDLPWQGATYRVAAQEIAQRALTPPQWRRLAAGEGEGAKGPRIYDWALVRWAPLQQAGGEGVEQALLIRRPLDAPDDPKELTSYLVFAPTGALLETLVAVAGRRWTMLDNRGAF
jgi:SRSO17 transposase